MTCHVAIRGSDGLVLFSDTQASSADTQYHGVQKQFVGSDFVLGCAGAMLVIRALFEELERTPGLSAATVERAVEHFLESEVTPEARRSIELVLGVPSGIKTLVPAFFTHFRNENVLATIGSGAPFVYRAFGRDQKLGIQFGAPTLADLFVAAESNLDAAAESLTVDDLLMVSFLQSGRAYVMGAADVSVSTLPESIRLNWTEASEKCAVIVALCENIRGEFGEALRATSKARVSTLTQPDLDRIALANLEIARRRSELTARLTEYMTWYDSFVRPATAARTSVA
jgi:ATP-dependent protease HslVU (ClpYQ) peptidase subunit